ncbi:MAG: V-type ATP synthase subunit D [Candidatus Thermoplasmatota archaeon]|nr:V-type ATP synthase subunit D [Candidatus Thermoplasmatota archaeon]
MTEEMLEGVNPTRMELLEIRKKVVLAEKGHKLLEEKRDALVEKFFSVIEKRNALKKQVDEGFHDAFLSLIQAQMLLGEQQVDDASDITPDIGEISFETDNIMGVKIAKINTHHLRQQGMPLYGFSETCASLDDAYQKFNTLLRLVIPLAEVEENIQSLSIEIEKTKRRVNVLENTLIPKLYATIKYIEMRLEEQEREDFFRRKRIKALMEAKKEKDVA